MTDPTEDRDENPDDEVIHIELDDLPPEPENIVISDKDMEDVPPLPPAPPSNLEDLGAIELPTVPCAIDQTMIEPGQSFGYCKICRTPYHKECWDYNGGCAVLGCEGQKNPSAFEAATSL